MILTYLLPNSLSRSKQKDDLEIIVEFLENIIDEIESGENLQEALHKNWIPQLAQTSLEKFFFLGLNQGISILPALRELHQNYKFLFDLNREIEVEIAPMRATLNLLTYFPMLILLGAILAKVIPFDRTLFSPIPLGMIGISLVLQLLGRRWSESIISSARE